MDTGAHVVRCRCGVSDPLLLTTRRVRGEIRSKALCKVCAAARLKRYNAAMRLKCFAVLGPVCSCGETEPEFLTIEHTDNDGYLERKTKHPDTIKRDILSGRADAGGYEVLCRNCNDSKDMEIRRTLLIGETDRKLARQAVRSEVIHFLGGVCTCCGASKESFLTVDHIHNDGGSRTDLPRGGTDLYKKILDGATTVSDFQLLCWNCNFSKHLGGGLCVHQRRRVEVG